MKRELINPDSGQNKPFAHPEQFYSARNCLVSAAGQVTVHVPEWSTDPFFTGSANQHDEAERQSQLDTTSEKMQSD